MDGMDAVDDSLDRTDQRPQGNRQRTAVIGRLAEVTETHCDFRRATVVFFLGTVLTCMNKER